MSAHDEPTPFHLTKPNPVDYIVGFILAVTLTVIAFLVVAFGDSPRPGPSILLVAILAAIQIGVHMRYFLHYSTKRVPFEATVAMALAGFMAIAMLAGSLWVMGDLHTRMMP